MLGAKLEILMPNRDDPTIHRSANATRSPLPRYILLFLIKALLADTEKHNQSIDSNVPSDSISPPMAGLTKTVWRIVHRDLYHADN